MCYAFTAIAQLEAVHFLEYGRELILSEQQIIDCSYEDGNRYCSGGHFAKAFRHAYKYPVMLEKDYPYIQRGSSCKYNATLGRV